MKPLGPWLAVAAVFAAPPALAGNQHSFLLGDKAALTGGAVTAINADGASLWYNPAGLAADLRDTIDISGSAYVLRVRDFPKIIRAELPDGDRYLSLNSTDIISVPSALAYVRNLSDDLSLGFGLFAPLADQYDASSNLNLDAPGLSGEAAMRFTGESTTYAGTVGLGWRASETVRLGATLVIYYQTARTTETLLYGFISDIANDQTAATGTQIQEDSSVVVGMQIFAGIQWQVLPEFAVGLVLRSPGVFIYESFDSKRFDLGAEVDTEGTAEVRYDSSPFSRDGFTGSVLGLVNGTLALAWTPAPDTYLAFEVELQSGAEDKESGVVSEALWNLRLGGTYALSDTFTFGLGVFTDRSHEPKSQGNAQIHYYGFAGGIHFETPLIVNEDDGEGSLVFSSSFGLRYAIGLGGADRLEVTPEGFILDDPPVEIGLTFHEFSLHIGSGLHF